MLRSGAVDGVNIIIARSRWLASADRSSERSAGGGGGRKGRGLQGAHAVNTSVGGSGGLYLEIADLEL